MQPLTAPPPNRLEYAGVSVRRGGVLTVDAVDLAIPAGSFVALTGASGAGKTTLLRLANRLIAEKSRPQCDLFWNNEELRTVQLVEAGVLSDEQVAWRYKPSRTAWPPATAMTRAAGC